MISDLFEYRHVTVLEDRGLPAVGNGRVILKRQGKKKELEADSVVIVVGFCPAPSMTQDLQSCGAAAYEIGDGQQVGIILRAV